MSLNLQQSFSSLPSAQSNFPSHLISLEMHERPRPQYRALVGQYEHDNSSSRFGQSATPSHIRKPLPEAFNCVMHAG